MTVTRADWRRLLIDRQAAAGRVWSPLRWAARWLLRAPVVVRSDTGWQALPVSGPWHPALRAARDQWHEDRQAAAAMSARWYDCDDATREALRSLRRYESAQGAALPPAVGVVSYRHRAGGWHAALIAVVRVGEASARLAVLEPQAGHEVALTDAEWRSVREVRL